MANHLFAIHPVSWNPLCTHPLLSHVLVGSCEVIWDPLVAKEQTKCTTETVAKGQTIKIAVPLSLELAILTFLQNTFECNSIFFSKLSLLFKTGLKWSIPYFEIEHIWSQLLIETDSTDFHWSLSCLNLPPQVIVVAGTHCRSAKAFANECNVLRQVIVQPESIVAFLLGAGLSSEKGLLIVHCRLEALSRSDQRVIWQWRGERRDDPHEECQPSYGLLDRISRGTESAALD